MYLLFWWKVSAVLEFKRGLMRFNDWKLWTVLAGVLFLGGLGCCFRPVVEEGFVAAKSISQSFASYFF